MTEDEIRELGQALAAVYDDALHEPLSERERDLVLELAVAEALVEF